MKKEFDKAEVEVVEFDKEDVISTSPTSVIIQGPGPMEEEEEENE